MKCFFVLLLALASVAYGLKIKGTKQYSTSEDVASDQPVFSIQFSLDKQDLNLYADINGKLIPVAKSGAAYQASWVVPSALAKKGKHSVDIYTREGYLEMEKYHTEGEGERPKPIETLEVVYKGMHKSKLPVPLGVVALLGAVCAFLWSKSVVEHLLGE